MLVFVFHMTCNLPGTVHLFYASTYIGKRLIDIKYSHMEFWSWVFLMHFSNIKIKGTSLILWMVLLAKLDNNNYISLIIFCMFFASCLIKMYKEHSLTWNCFRRKCSLSYVWAHQGYVHIMSISYACWCRTSLTDSTSVEGLPVRVPPTSCLSLSIKKNP